MPFFLLGVYMKTYLSLLLAVMLLPACQQLMNGQQQPVKTKANGEYLVSCGGAVETWGNCNNKAADTCPKGFVVLNKEEDSTGIVRQITFACKK
jgi:hypothetical protein